MPTLHDRLVAAVTARRELAQVATMIGGQRWHFVPDLDSGDDQHGDIVDDAGWTIAAGYMNPDALALVLANDPAQILRDTEAHLKILALYQRYVNAVERGRKTGLHHDDPEGAAQDRACEMVLREAVRALAGIYPEVTEQ